MKKFGLVGGIGPASTAIYYQSIIDAFRKRLNTEDYPDFIIRSINMNRMLRYVVDNDLDGLTEFLLEHIDHLTDCGVEFSALASNTPHIVFDRLAERSGIQLLSIVGETCKAIASKSLTKVGLFGTKSTMEAGFYHRAAEKLNVNIVTPNSVQMDFIHNKYFEELVANKINQATRDALIQIAHHMKESSGIQGLVLGGTELSLILSQSDFHDIELFDTTQIHVSAIVREMIKE
ncbi:MAG: amino acid racemase [Cyclobacteriaceae bacterium]